MADINDLLEYYADLLILQYHGKPKAAATIKMFVQAIIADGLFMDIIESFDLDTAEGVQLDTIGRLVGCPRYVPGIGYLSDTDYRYLLRFKIVLNNMSAKEKDIDDSLWDNFKGDFVAVNEKKMSMSYIAASKLTTVLQAVLELNYLPLPLGVKNSGILIQVPDPLKIFGFANDPNNMGFSTKDQTGEGAFLDKDNIKEIRML